MKTGKHYFGLLTEEEQRNFRQACEEQKINFNALMNLLYANFYTFIMYDVNWNKSEQGIEHWFKIANSNRFKSETKPLATFRLIFIYIAIVSTFLGLLWLVYHTGHKQGYKSGYRHGIEKVDSIVNYEELTTESVEAVQKLQLNTMRDGR